MSILNFGKLQRQQEMNPSSFYNFFLPGVQAVASGAVADQSGNGNDFVLGGGTVAYSDVWANAGYFSTISGNDNGVKSDAGIAGFDFVAGDSMILAFTMNAARVAVADYHVGEAFNSATKGIGVQFRNTDDKLTFYIADGIANTAIGTADSIFQGGLDHNVVFALDGTTKKAYIWNDGEVVAWQAEGDLSTVVGDTVNTVLPFIFGYKKALVTSIAAQFRSAHSLTLPAQGLPDNMTEIVAKLHGKPFHPLQDSDFL